VTNYLGVQGYWNAALIVPPIGQRAWCRRLGTRRVAARMAEDLPGFIPHVLRLDDISLLRADETVLNAMVDARSWKSSGW
jgi:hypothetical protein